MGNVWTDQALAQDIHAGDSAQAFLIRRENNLRGHIVCGICGAQAHYKHSVGAHKCIECGALGLAGGRDWIS